MNELESILEAMSRAPREKLVDALRRIHEDKAGGTSRGLLDVLRTETPAPEAKTESTSAYDSARRGMLDYERTIRGYSDQVGRFLDAVRRRSTTETKLTASLPQLILRAVAQAEGRSGARFVVRNERSTAASMSLKPGVFTTHDGAMQASPGVELEPADLTVQPGDRAIVTMHVDFAGTGFLPGSRVRGDVVVEVGGEQSMLVAIEAELDPEMR